MIRRDGRNCAMPNVRCVRQKGNGKVTKPVAPRGGGPVGLAAAAQGLAHGMPPLTVAQGDRPGHAVRAWGHVPVFSAWRDSFRIAVAGGWLAGAGPKSASARRGPCGRVTGAPAPDPGAKALAGSSRGVGLARQDRQDHGCRAPCLADRRGEVPGGAFLAVGDMTALVDLVGTRVLWPGRAPRFPGVPDGGTAGCGATGPWLSKAAA